MPGEERATPPQKTAHWEVKPHPKYPNDRKKDQWKAMGNGGGYQTKQGGTPPPGLEAVSIWMEDMNEWGTMMYEAVMELRQRIDELERKGGRRRNAAAALQL
jgi:hypothetical protein